MSEISIVCHGETPHFLGRRPVWRQGDDPNREAPKCSWCGGNHPFGAPRTWRNCEYCGSMHPEDLVAALKAGAILGGSDWKYGWPHKFYVTAIPNPYPELLVSTYGKSNSTCEAPHPVASLGGKWYNEHLLDLAGTPLFTELTDLLEEKAGIRFEIDDKGLSYRAPHAGYQR